MRTLIRTDTVVSTRHGQVRGNLINGVISFLGIPYAAPPFGANRLRPPQPVEPWSGVRDAVSYGAKPPQSPYPPPWDVLIPERGPNGEDCLNLNIWTPSLDTSGLPVMVWIPGGMFEAGSGATYDGKQFARDGVVCVTINYRIGAEGFLFLGEGNANRGLHDQVAALEWVRENISSFGGDPDNITVFGESAGAMSIGTLLAMPRAKGLFRRAIVESGGAHQVLPAESANRVRQSLAKRLGVEATREGISAASPDRLLQAQRELKADLLSNPDPTRWGAELVLSMLPWQPVIDGDVIPARPIDRVEAGVGASIDLIVGSNLDESNFFLVPGGAIDQISPEVLAGAIVSYGLPLDKTLATYRALRPGASDGELLSAIQSDWCFRIPALRLAEAHARAAEATTYAYEFVWRSRAFNGRLGACHGIEIPFVFDMLPTESDPLLGSDSPQELARTMHGAWAAFASRGDPGWPRFDLNHRTTMRFDAHSGPVKDPQLAQRKLWNGVR